MFNKNLRQQKNKKEEQQKKPSWKNMHGMYDWHIQEGADIQKSYPTIGWTKLD